MTNQQEIFKCEVCGNIVEVLHAGAGSLTCCGQHMKKKIAGTSDGAAEKHVPVIEKTAQGYLVKVGSVEHPSTPAHYIEWIEIFCPETGFVQCKWLKPGETPQALFSCQATHIIAREYCNLHGLWEAEFK